MRILIGPVEVAGVAAGLKSGFDRLGVEADLVLSQPHPFGYRVGIAPSPVARIWVRLGERLARPSERWGRAAWLVNWAVWKAWSVIVWAWALHRYDGFIFLFGNTLTNLPLEARLYRWLGRKVAMVYCGSDARPPYVDGYICQSADTERPAVLERLARRTKRRVQRLEACGFVCVNNPCTGQFHVAPFVNWFEIGLPRDVRRDEPEERSPAPQIRGKPAVRIVHSPSNPTVKGTALVLEIVESLREEGHEIDLVLLEGLSNSEVLRQLRQCDFVIDQCYSDAPVAALAVEAANLGKPSVVGGYAATEAGPGTFTSRPPPSLFVRPDALKEAVRRMVADEPFRRALGEAAERFMLERWAPEQIAARYLALLEHGPAPEQLVQPSSLRYVHGYAMTEAVAGAKVAALVRECGVAALHLGHNPALEAAFLRLARGEPAP